jgi:tight adherence protein B
MIWIALSLLVAGLAFVILLLLNNDDKPVEDETAKLDTEGDVPDFIKNYLAANGVELPAVIIYSALAVAAAALLLSALLLPTKLALMVVLLIPAVLVMLTKAVGAKRRAKMLAQLPSFINQITRRLSAGISVENAFSDSVETLERPLGTVMRRIVRRVHLGDELHKSFDREAKASKLQEFGVLATSLRINEQYGGSIRAILDDIVAILRLDDAGKRELSAMTGETRFTAMVLALLPPGIAGYMFYQNPNMLLDMWATPSGQSLLLLAIGMEILGVVVLWRMVKSIGR